METTTRIGVWDKQQNRFVYLTTERRRQHAETRCSNLQAQFIHDSGYFARPGRRPVRYEVRVVS
jgi:hypothetical protein